MTDDQFRALCNTYGFAPSRSLRELLDTAVAQDRVDQRHMCAALAEPEERNFCPRCGKRTSGIHTCTPP